VVATDSGDVQDLLGQVGSIHGSDDFRVCERGILCKKENAKGFAMALKYVINDPPDSSGRLHRDRDFVEERFSEQRLLRDIDALYMELMEKR